MTIALVGDYNQSVIAHQAIPVALELNSETRLKYEWVNSIELDDASFSAFSGFWVVPASPYESMDNVLKTIQYARLNDIPFLGTCGGFQHAALEFARNKLGYSNADNTEVNPNTPMPLISGLSCKLYDASDSVILKENSIISEIYGKTKVVEDYYCGYGVNPQYLSLFEDSDMQFTGFDIDNDPKVLEISSNHFFIGTAFQPERSALQRKKHPLISSFVSAVSSKN